MKNKKAKHKNIVNPERSLLNFTQKINSESVIITFSIDQLLMQTAFIVPVTFEDFAEDNVFVLTPVLSRKVATVLEENATLKNVLAVKRSDSVCQVSVLIASLLRIKRKITNAAITLF